MQDYYFDDSLNLLLLFGKFIEVKDKYLLIYLKSRLILIYERNIGNVDIV